MKVLRETGVKIEVEANFDALLDFGMDFAAKFDIRRRRMN